MCLFKVKTPQVSQLETPATDLLPQTNAAEPESPAYGGTEDASSKRKGRNALKINLSTGSSYNPVSI